MSSTGTSDTVVLIHGLWMTPRSWERWIERYTVRGYKVIAPSWPGMEPEVEQLQRDPSPIAGLSVGEVVDHYERIIRGLNRPRSSWATPSAAPSSSSCWTAVSAPPAWQSMPRRCGGC